MSAKVDTSDTNITHRDFPVCWSQLQSFPPPIVGLVQTIQLFHDGAYVAHSFNLNIKAMSWTIPRDHVTRLYQHIQDQWRVFPRLSSNWWHNRPWHNKRFQAKEASANGGGVVTSTLSTAV
jgi:hypothetical protein